MCIATRLKGNEAGILPVIIEGYTLTVKYSQQSNTDDG